MTLDSLADWVTTLAVLGDFSIMKDLSLSVRIIPQEVWPSWAQAQRSLFPHTLPLDSCVGLIPAEQATGLREVGSSGSVGGALPWRELEAVRFTSSVRVRLWEAQSRNAVFIRTRSPLQKCIVLTAADCDRAERRDFERCEIRKWNFPGSSISKSAYKEIGINDVMCCPSKFKNKTPFLKREK